MALGDITIYRQSSAQGGRGSNSMPVMASAFVIQPGEPLMIVAGASAAIPGAQGATLLAVASPYVPVTVAGMGFLGVTQTTATNTASLAGSVDYVPTTSQTTFLINAQTPSLINTQAKYDALVNARVLINATSQTATSVVYTCALADSAQNGFLVRPLDIFKFPNKVAISPRDSISATF